MNLSESECEGQLRLRAGRSVIAFNPYGLDNGDCRPEVSVTDTCFLLSIYFLLVCLFAFSVLQSIKITIRGEDEGEDCPPPPSPYTIVDKIMITLIHLKLSAFFIDKLSSLFIKHAMTESDSETDLNL